MIAGTWWFTVASVRHNVKFVPPPPVDMKTIQLKKPTVKQKKTKPSGGSTKIVSKSKTPNVSFQLPEVSGTGKTGFGDGLGGGLGGYELMPDVSSIGMFGGTKSVAVGNDFEGTFYSLEFNRRGEKVTATDEDLDNAVDRFMEADWNPIAFSPYYRCPQKLYTTHLMIPPTASEHAPEQFGVDLREREMDIRWIVFYKGKIARKEGGRYCFCVTADNFMIIRVNKKVVVKAGFLDEPLPSTALGDWKPADKESGKYLFGHGFATVGDWFELEPGIPVEMEVIIGEYGGGWSMAMVNVEDAAEKMYCQRNKDGLPVLPAFKTAEIPKSLREQMEYLLIRDEVILDDPLMFNVY